MAISIAKSDDNMARAMGFTRHVWIEGGMSEGDFLIKPDTDLDDVFRAWALDWGEWINVHGYNCFIEEVAS